MRKEGEIVDLSAHEAGPCRRDLRGRKKTVERKLEPTSLEACKLSISSCENCTGVSEAKTCFVELAAEEDWDAPIALFGGCGLMVERNG